MEGIKLSVVDHFEGLEDPRSRKSKHNFMEIIIITICAGISGMLEWDEIVLFAEMKEDWLKEKLGLSLENGIPSVHTFRRVISAIEFEAFQMCFVSWVQSICKVTKGDVVSIDGKSLRGSYKSSLNKEPLHSVSAWACEAGFSLGQVVVADKSNEIVAIPKLLEKLHLKGCIVTIDAMGTQKNIAKMIQEASADYVLALKGNQGYFFETVANFLDNGLEKGFEGIKHTSYCSEEKGHGRIEKRFCYVVPAANYANLFRDSDKWSGLKSVALVKSEVTNMTTGLVSIEHRYFISSLDPEAEKIANAIRSHWNIENNLHWTLDVVFREDASRIRTDDAPLNMAAIRRLALSFLKQEKTYKKSMKLKQKRAFASSEYLEKILTSIIP